jgi:hypothetical protein
VLVGWDDTWVLVNGVYNFFFGSMDALAFARGALIILFGAIFNFIFGWMGALAFGRGAVFFSWGQQLKLLKLLLAHSTPSPLEAPSSSSSSSPSSSPPLVLLFPLT